VVAAVEIRMRFAAEAIAVHPALVVIQHSFFHHLALTARATQATQRNYLARHHHFQKQPLAALQLALSLASAGFHTD